MMTEKQETTIKFNGTKSVIIAFANATHLTYATLPPHPRSVTDIRSQKQCMTVFRSQYGRVVARNTIPIIRINVNTQHKLQATETTLFVSKVGYWNGNQTATKRSNAIISKIREWMAPKEWIKYICVKHAPNKDNMSFHQYLAMIFGRVTAPKRTSVIARWKMIKCQFVKSPLIYDDNYNKKIPQHNNKEKNKQKKDTSPQYSGDSPGNPIIVKSFTIVMFVYFIIICSINKTCKHKKCN